MGLVRKDARTVSYSLFPGHVGPAARAFDLRAWDAAFVRGPLAAAGANAVAPRAEAEAAASATALCLATTHSASCAGSLARRTCSVSAWHGVVSFHWAPWKNQADGPC